MKDGNIDENGITCITVVTDGAWGKRSYNVNYDSMSGVVSITYHNTKHKNFFLRIVIVKI